MDSREFEAGMLDMKDAFRGITDGLQRMILKRYRHVSGRAWALAVEMMVGQRVKVDRPTVSEVGMWIARAREKLGEFGQRGDCDKCGGYRFLPAHFIHEEQVHEAVSPCPACNGGCKVDKPGEVQRRYANAVPLSPEAMDAGPSDATVVAIRSLFRVEGDTQLPEKPADMVRAVSRLWLAGKLKARGSSQTAGVLANLKPEQPPEEEPF